MDREVVKELIQDEFNSENIKVELTKILNPENRKQLSINFANLKQNLGGEGASNKTAELIVNSLKM
jgi:lipid-A-disaccharide synthase